MDNKLIHNIPEVVRILFEGAEAAPTGVYVKPNDTIIRARYGHGHHSVAKLTYRPEEECLELQRASIQYESVFYGCLGEQMIEDQDGFQAIKRAMATCAAETSRLMRNPDAEDGYEERSFSQWNIMRRLRVISFITDETFTDSISSELAFFRDLYVKRMSLLTETQREIMRYINHEFTKPVESDKEYEFTANLCHYLMQEYRIREQRIDAIIYPSVQTRGELGVNIAISKKASDEALEFEHLFENVLIKRGRDVVLTVQRQYNSCFELMNGT